MALTQMQIIQSLGESMAWFQKEIDWGVPPTELRHLCGRIGELYAALITNGQMALDVNQHGYDVVSALGEKVSVKTTAKMGSSGHIAFNSNTLDLVDRIIILRINTEEMQVEILLNETISNAKELMAKGKANKLNIALSKLVKQPKDYSQIPVVDRVMYKNNEVIELENGSIQVLTNGEIISPSKPVLREIAKNMGINILNGNGNPHNTRQLGSLIVAALKE